MLGFFPEPYPDETLFSIISRLIELLNPSAAVAIISELFNNRTIMWPSTGMPSRLHDFFNNLPAGHNYSFQEFILNHTLAPYYVPFSSPEISQMLEKCKVNRSITTLGSTNLKYCPLCVIKDRSLFLEPYWHCIHQAPGVDVCPFHKCYLETTSVPAYNAKMVQIKLVSLNHYFDTNELKEPKIIDEDKKHDLILFQIALDTMYILKTHFSSLSQDEFHARLKRLLHKNNYLFKTGSIIKMSDLTSDFINHYSNKFLETFFKSFSANTIRTFFIGLFSRYYRKRAMYPVRILLVLRFLGCSAKLFFNMGMASIPTGHFGSGPWPCLNKASEHYRINTIFNAQEYWGDRAKDHFGVFKCPKCGYTYKYKSSTPEKISVICYGPEWENKFRTLINHNSSRNIISEEMGISRSAVDHKIALTAGSLNLKKNIQKEEKRNHFRHLWLEYQNKYPNATITELHDLDSPVYNWLYENDRDWFKDHKPPRKPSNINWDLRDRQFKKLAERAVKNILDSNDRPIRLTINSILTRITYVNKEWISKYPLTMQYLMSAVESRDDFYKRRIQWAIQEYISNGIYPTNNKIRRLIVLPRQYKSCIIDNEIEIACQEVYNALYCKINSL